MRISIYCCLLLLIFNNVFAHVTITNKTKEVMTAQYIGIHGVSCGSQIIVPEEKGTYMPSSGVCLEGDVFVLIYNKGTGSPACSDGGNWVTPLHRVTGIITGPFTTNPPLENYYCNFTDSGPGS